MYQASSMLFDVASWETHNVQLSQSSKHDIDKFCLYLPDIFRYTIGIQYTKSAINPLKYIYVINMLFFGSELSLNSPCT